MKSIFNEIHSGYVAVFSIIGIFGFVYSYYQKYGNKKFNNEKNNNINGIDIMDIDKVYIKLRNGKNMTIGNGLIDDDNETYNIICILGISLVSVYATYKVINSKTKNDDNM